MKTPSLITKILASRSSSLRTLLSQSDRLQQFNLLVQQHLPEPLCHHCQCAAINDTKLVLQVDSPAWATKLRLYLPTLLKGLQATLQGGQIKTVRLRIRPAQSVRQNRFRQRLQMSQSTSKLLLGLSDSTTNPDLKAALLRLSKHAHS